VPKLNVGRIAAGADPQAEKEAAKTRRAGIITVDDLLDAHLKLYVGPRKLRTHHEITRAYDKYIRPVIGRVPVRDLRRSHVVGLLDRIATKNGPVMADRVLAYLRKPLNWHATRDDEFVVPIVPGMAHTRPRERARDRILNDDEIRALWTASDDAVAGGYVYDRHDYAAEKRAALEALDLLVNRIVDPSYNVVELAAHRQVATEPVPQRQIV